jgi:uncharacterized repeat protein (TIGR03803 family)
MFETRAVYYKWLFICGLTLTTFASLDGAYANGFEVLYAFKGGGDAESPTANVIRDNNGNFYGTTTFGGANNLGSIFMLAPDGTETVLYSFIGGSNGNSPVAGLVRDKEGNLSGTTPWSGSGCGCGVVFRVGPDGSEIVLHAFAGGSDGAIPKAGLTAGKKGSLYGTTQSGGKFSAGTVFRISRNGSEKVLHSFGSGSDGSSPVANVIFDQAGDLYGTTESGGAGGDGTVFEIAADGTESVLRAFSGSNEGSDPVGGLVMDASGNVYGTTEYGGSNACGGLGCGTIFELAPDGTETVLYSFTGATDGGYPTAGLIIGKGGNLYGTTSFDGSDGAGNVFKLAPDGTETVLHSFTDGSDGGYPAAGLTKDELGYIGGTTPAGGNGYGTVFALKK